VLHHLRVKNLGVLEDAVIEPAPGFTVISGETGTGKTMLLGALRLLAGGKASSASVGPFADTAQIDGLFNSDGSEAGVSRVLPKEGRSRGYIDGAVVSTATLEARIGDLVEIVGQHDRMRLRRPAAVLGLIDDALDEVGRSTRSDYVTAWERYRALKAEQESLGGDRMLLERELDLLRHQVSEIDRADLKPGDESELDVLANRLRNAGLIGEQLGSAVAALEKMAESSGQVVAGLRKVAEIDPTLAEQLTSAEALAVSAADLLWSLRSEAETALDDPEALAEIETRLNELGDLKRKYGRTVDEILVFAAESRLAADEMTEKLRRSEVIDSELSGAEQEVGDLAKSLRSARQQRCEALRVEVSSHLSDLGLASASIEFGFEEREPGPTGTDRVRLMFRSDPNLDAGPVEDIASGGELSRLVLALRLVTTSEETTTLVFDEVDAGVGGAAALALGRKLAQLSKRFQVLCVTHLPQIAAHADIQYAVEREGAAASVQKISGDQRLEEISRMLAGLPDSSLGKEAAAELLTVAQS
jgi:DNA repair protein RecN (Recombination protein N)